MIGYVYYHPVLRPYVILILIINVFLVGPATVGVAVLAQDRFVGSAATLGVMLSAMGIGGVLGSLAVSAIKIKRFGLIFLTNVGLTGLTLALLGITSTLLVTALLFGGIAALFGFSNVLLLTWFGKQIPADMMGRFMSLYVLLAVGMAPLSNALAGFTFGFSIAGTFIIAGSMLMISAIVAGLNPILRDMEL